MIAFRTKVYFHSQRLQPHLAPARIEPAPPADRAKPQVGHPARPKAHITPNADYPPVSKTASRASRRKAVAFLVLVSALGILISISTGSAANATTLLSDSVLVSSGTVVERGPMASSGDVTAFVYSDVSGSWVYRSGYAPAPVPTVDWYGAQYALSNANTLTVFSGAGPVTARRYDLSSGRAILVESRTFGNVDSRAGTMTNLASGGIVVMWHQQTRNADGHVDLYFSYRSPAGIWQEPFSVAVSGSDGPTFNTKALAQHPVDGSIWAFNKKDSQQRIGATHMTENANGLVVDWVNNDFINHTNDQPHGPSGELPSLIAIPDPWRGTIDLAYQNENQRIFSTVPFVKGAYVSVAQIAVDGRKNFIMFPRYVERVLELGLVVSPTGIALSYRPVDSIDLTFDDVFISSYDGGAWGEATYVTTLLTGRTRTAFATGAVDIAAQGLDGSLHVYRPAELFTSAATPTPLTATATPSATTAPPTATPAPTYMASATPSPSAIQSPTISPTLAPTPTSTALGSPNPTPTPSDSSSPVPTARGKAHAKQEATH